MSTRESLVRRGALLLCGALLSFVSCMPQVSFTQTSATSYMPRKPNCDFKVATTLPDGSFKALGIVDVTPGPGGDPRTASDFHATVQETVCQAGGHLVVAEINGHGTYIRGTVYRLKEPD